MERRAEHLLEKLYLRSKEIYEEELDVHYLGRRLPDPEADAAARKEAEETLIDARFAVRQNGSVIITDAGIEAARDLTRRYRLAERLLNDLLLVKGDEVSVGACAMEHILSPSVTDSICTLLGHPPVCPHGKPIPPGACCDGDKQELRPVVVALDQVPIGQDGRITFVASRVAGRIEQLSAMGVTSGARIRLVQRRPSVVIDTGETRIAVEKDIAREIFVRLGGGGNGALAAD
ncbi:MAG: metal-dependent transcriptional regulator [Candidatus Schekmanbacteria bacterium]|nr:metal-dependent transcriptional regulator [Candidatus Schekmanbacteria bacterium]